MKVLSLAAIKPHSSTLLSIGGATSVAELQKDDEKKLTYLILEIGAAQNPQEALAEVISIIKKYSPDVLAVDLPGYITPSLERKLPDIKIVYSINGTFMQMPREKTIDDTYIKPTISPKQETSNEEKIEVLPLGSEVYVKSQSTVSLGLSLFQKR